MSETVKAVADRARALPPIERLRVVDEIPGSLDEIDPVPDRLWAREAGDRRGCVAAWRNARRAAG